MKTETSKLLAILTGALLSMGLLTGCFTKSAAPATPTAAAVQMQDSIRGVFVHTGQEDLPITSPLDTASIEQEIDALVAFAKGNGLNTIYLDAVDAQGAFYQSSTLPVHPAFYKDSEPMEFDLLERVVSAAAEQQIQVYAVLDPLYLSSGLETLPEDHPAKQHTDWTVTTDGGIFWDLGNEKARGQIVETAKELALRYGISGIVYQENPRSLKTEEDPAVQEALISLIQETKTALSELQTGKKLAITASFGTADGPGDASPSIQLLSDASPDYVLAVIHGTVPIQAQDDVVDYTDLIDVLLAVTANNSVKPIPVLDLSQQTEDPYQVNYQVAYNLSAGVGLQESAIEGYRTAVESPYYPALSMHKLYLDPDVYSNVVNTDIKPGFAITRPANRTKTSYAKYFINVIADPNEPLYFNGQELSTTAHGLAGVLVDLNYGPNTFTFTQNGERRSVQIDRSQPASGGGAGVISKLSSMYPTTASAQQVGDEITLRCVAPAGSTVSAHIAGMEIPLKQAVATASEGIAATYTGTAVFDAEVADNEVKNIGKITYRLSYNGKDTTYESAGELFAVGENAALVMEVTDYMSGVTVDDTQANAGNFITTLIEGSRDYVDLSKHSDTHFFLHSGGAIRKGTVKLLEGSNVTIAHTLGTPSVTSNAKGDTFTLPGGAHAAWHAEMTDSTLEVTLYNTQNPALSLNGEHFSLSGTQGRLLLQANPGSEFWGYDITYHGDDLQIYCKRRPAISQDPDRPLSNMTIVIDPGHGGFDPGSLGVAYGYGLTEDGVNMATSIATKEALERMGATVILTLSPNEYSSNEKLVLFDRMKIAKEHDADLFLSMHHNSTVENVDGYSYTGTEVYYFTAHSQKLAETVVSNVTAATGRKNRGSIQSYYVVTKMTYCPAILSELGFLVNPVEYEAVNNPAVIYRTANAYVKSVFDLLK